MQENAEQIQNEHKENMQHTKNSYETNTEKHKTIKKQITSIREIQINLRKRYEQTRKITQQCENLQKPAEYEQQYPNTIEQT
jgi:hypothetical protein